MNIVPLTINRRAAVVHLTKGYIAIVDVSDWAIVGDKKWCVVGKEPRVYAYRRRIVNGRSVGLYMHRSLMNPPKGKDVDHQNRKVRDNRRSNLLVVTRGENMQNCRKRNQKRKATSRFVGVSWDAARELWTVRVKRKRKSVSLGRFASEWEAASVRDKYVREHYTNPVRYLNFPDAA